MSMLREFQPGSPCVLASIIGLLSAISLREAAATDETLLYDLDFSAPTHVLNETPTLGARPHKVSKIVFGAPQVVPAFGPLTDRPLLLRGDAGNSQIKVNIPSGWRKYRIEYDVTTNHLKDSEGSFTVLLDTPTVRTLSLSGRINRVVNWPNPTPPSELTTWSEGGISHFVIEVDLAQNLWEIWKDGTPILSTPLNATTLQSVRFALAGAPAAEVAVDNLKIVGSDRTHPLAPPPPAPEFTLYDIDFGAPTHTAGQPPTVGATNDRVTKVALGSPRVVSEFASFTDQSLLFRGESQPSQIRLDVGEGASRYRVECDVVTRNLKDSDYGFSVYVNSPGILRSVTMHGGEQLHLQYSRDGSELLD